jgi:Flp pilus assembly protein TadD
MSRRKSMADLMKRKRNGRNTFSRGGIVPARHFAARALRTAILPAAVCLGGCQSSGQQDVTAQSAPHRSAPVQGDKRRAMEEWGRQYDRHPEDKATALNYARALRGTTEYPQAAAVLQRLAIKFPRDTDVLGAYGKALADAGRLREAAQVLPRAYARPAKLVHPLRTGLGCRSARRSRTGAGLLCGSSQNRTLAAPCPLQSRAFLRAFKKAPSGREGAPGSGGAARCRSRVRQNLSLVLALEGKFNSAEEVSRRDLNAKDAASNVATIRHMIAQSNTWKQIQELDSKPDPAAKMKVGQRTD